MSFWNTCILAYCRLGIAGLSPKAPGTAGSALAALLAPLLFLPLPLWGRLLFLAVIVVTGGLAATRAEILLGRTDPGEVVIDELVGVWIALLPLGAGQWSWPGLVWAFALFRLFDIWKPWPVHASENWLPAGWGIMLDDILAGLMAMCCMLVLRALGRFREADRSGLQRCLGWLLALVAVCFVAVAFAGGASGLMNSLSSLRAGNRGNEHLLGLSYGFLVLGWVVDSLPYVLDVLVVLLARQLLEELERDRYSQAAVAAAERLSRGCVWALGISLVSNLALQLAQLLWARWLFTLDTQVQFPLLSMAFVLGALLLAQFIRENKQLKDDNDLFV